MTDAPHCTYPVYVFARRPELENPNRLLAGTLRLNTFGQNGLSHRQRRELAEIVADLTEDARAGRLPPVKIGWSGDGRRPMNAADVADEAVMASWSARAVSLFLRVDAHGEATITLDGPRSRRASSVCFHHVERTRPWAAASRTSEARRPRGRGQSELYQGRRQRRQHLQLDAALRPTPIWPGRATRGPTKVSPHGSPRVRPK